MRTFKLLSLLLTVFALSHCGTTEPAINTNSSSLLEAFTLSSTVEDIFFAMADSANGALSDAIERTANSIRSQTNVQSVTVLGHTYIDILLKSGLRTAFFIDQIDADSISIFRGGNPKKAKIPKLSKNRPLSTNTISNLKVLFYGAANNEFYKTQEMLDVVNRIYASPLSLNLIIKINEDCTPQTVETFKEYGLVIIDTHGAPDAFLTGTIIYFPGIPANEEEIKARIVQEAGIDTYNKILSGEIRIANHVRINTLIPLWQKHPKVKTYKMRLLVTTKYIQGLPSMPNTVVFGNTCYSGAEIDRGSFSRPMQKAWMDKDPISYYGYSTDDGLSAPVRNGFAKVMLDTFIRSLAIDLDSTLDVNLTANRTEFYEDVQEDSASAPIKLYFRHYGADDYSYEKCGDTLIDPRDGQKYKTTCIGKMVWMAQNLNYNEPGSMCYDNNSTNCALYGRLYTWDMIMQGADSSSASPSGVQGICPAGWHVPSFKEYQLLVETVGGKGKGENALKDTILWQLPANNIPINTNSTGFSALPGGYSLMDGIKFTSRTYLADFWTTSASHLATGGIMHVYSYQLSFDNSSGNEVILDNRLLLSCRCVKD